MAESGESPRLSDELGPVDYLMHRGEANPRTRSGIMALELLDGTPDWDRFRTRFENASRRVLRLRQKVVVPTLPTAAPRWVVDPDFNLDFHVRRVRVSGPATLREVLDLAEVILQSPLDISRPLWTATLVEGMADGRAAMLLHVSHAVTDGVGGVEMFAQIYDLERDPPPRSTPPQPIPEDLSPNDLMRRGINHLPIAVVGGVLDALSGAVSMAGRAVLEPVSTVSGILGYARSGIRVLNRAAEPSPLLGVAFGALDRRTQLRRHLVGDGVPSVRVVDRDERNVLVDAEQDRVVLGHRAPPWFEFEGDSGRRPITRRCQATPPC